MARIVNAPPRIMEGASVDEPGVAGYVPTPPAGPVADGLRRDGTYGPTNSSGGGGGGGGGDGIPADGSVTNAKVAADAAIALSKLAVDPLARSAHTGTQAQNTVVNLVADLAAKATGAALSAHTADTANPHSVTKAQVGLTNADDTSDANKPVSTATQTALDGKASTAHTHADATTLVAGFLSTLDKTKLDGVASGATANATDAALRDRTTHTGIQSADTLTDGTTNKAFLATERTKLAGIAEGATANSTDTYLRDRANHTGTQAAGTITGLATVATTGAYADVSGTPTLGTLAGQDASGVAIAGGAIDNTPIGATTPSTGSFTTLESSGLFSGQSNAFLGGIAAGSTELASNLYYSGGNWLHASTGEGMILQLDASSLTIKLFTAPSAAVGAVATLTQRGSWGMAGLNGAIGATTPSTGAFTSLSATGTISTSDTSDGIRFTASTKGRVGADATNFFQTVPSDVGSFLWQRASDFLAWMTLDANGLSLTGTANLANNKSLVLASTSGSPAAVTNGADDILNFRAGLSGFKWTNNADSVVLATLSNTGDLAVVGADLSGVYKQAINAVAALDINCALGNYFTKTIAGASTFTVSNVPASRAFSFTLELTHTSGAVTWFSGVEWPGGTAPVLTEGKTHLFAFVTDDGGTRWRGASQVDYTN